MMTSTPLAPAPSDPPEPFTDRLRLAVAAYLARFVLLMEHDGDNSLYDSGNRGY